MSVPSRPFSRRPVSTLAALCLCCASITLGTAAYAGRAARPSADPSEFDYSPLPASGRVEMDIGPDSPVFDFHSGKSAYRAFRLPEGADPYLVDVVSYLVRAKDLDKAQAFYPFIAILNEDMLVSRTSDVDAVHFDLPVLERTSRPAYRLTVAVDPVTTHERYMVIFTSEELIEHGAPEVPTDNGAEPEASPRTFAGAAPYGTVRVIVQPMKAHAPNDARR